MKLFFYSANFIEGEIHFQECLNCLMQAHSWRKYPGGAKPVLAIIMRGQNPFFTLNFQVNSSVRGEAMQNFSSGQALPLRGWFDVGCRIAHWPKLMLVADLPSATMGFC